MKATTCPYGDLSMHINGTANCEDPHCVYSVPSYNDSLKEVLKADRVVRINPRQGQRVKTIREGSRAVLDTINLDTPQLDTPDLDTVELEGEGNEDDGPPKEKKEKG